MQWFNWIVKAVLHGYENSETVTIANNAATSSQFALHGARGLVVVVPAAGWTASDIGVELSDDSLETTEAASTWTLAEDGKGSRCKATGVENGSRRSYPLDASAWQVGAFKKARLVCLNTSSEAAVNQTPARSLIVKRIF